MNVRQRQRELDELHRRILRCVKCPLCESRLRAVPGEGPVSGRVMIVGEAPGTQEDVEGRPFVGRAGRFLNEMLGRAGLARGRLFLTNSVKCRPPDGRMPRGGELKTCKENWLDRQIDLVNPELIVLLGTSPVRQIFGASRPLSRLHGRIRTDGNRAYFVTYHPAAAMRFPKAGEAMMRDFRTLKRLVRSNRH